MTNVDRLEQDSDHSVAKGSSGHETPTRIGSHVWSDGSQPTVSILCNTFNHERFIAEALEGIILQETTFRVEVLVHDDASTDNTPAIISRYASRYPAMIKPVLQTDNQRAKGRRPTAIVMPMTQGKYIGWCEGDDYWTASDKLQSQVSLLESRPDASGCIHRADGWFEEQGKMVPSLFGPDERKAEYTLDDLLASGNFVPTASIVMRRAVCHPVPEWLIEAPHGDMAMLALGASAGPLLYLDRSMSVYRKHAGGIHSGEVTALQILRAIETLMVLGDRLSLHGREAFRRGLGRRLGQIETRISRYESLLRAAELKAEDQSRTIAEIMTSKTFRLGLFLNRVRNSLHARGY